MAERAAGRHRASLLSLRTRLVLLFALSTAIVIAVSTVSVVSVVNLLHARHAILAEVDPANLAADQLLVAYLNEETGVRGYILSGDRSLLEPYGAGVAQERPLSAELRRLLADHPHLLASVRGAERQASAWRAQFAEPAIAASAAGDPSYRSTAALVRGKSLFDGLRTRFDALDREFVTVRASTGARLDSATTSLVVSLVAALVLVIAMGVAVNRAFALWVSTPLRRLGSDVDQVTAGRLDHPISPSGPPELERLGTDVEAMRGRIVEELRAADTARQLLADRNQALTRSNAELEQFAYVASHDLQEPLRKVASFSQLLQQRYAGQLDERADQYIEFAVDGAKRMQLLINDLLAFSRVGRTTAGFEAVALRPSLDAALENLATLLEEANATVEIGPLPTVRGDPGLLTVLWQNLVGNAVKFRAEADPVVTIDATPGEDGWLLAVTDNGIGIEPRFADKVFVIFQRLHSREQFEGTGIGLALCRKIVEFHGGRIWLDVDHRPGAKLCFTLPATEEAST